MVEMAPKVMQKDVLAACKPLYEAPSLVVRHAILPLREVRLPNPLRLRWSQLHMTHIICTKLF